MTSVTDFLIRRQAEASQILAACACVFPLDTLEAMHGLNPCLLIDERARSYLLALTRHQKDLATGDPIELTIKLAFIGGLQVDLAGWMLAMIDESQETGLPAYQLAQRKVQEIKRLAITSTEIQYLLFDLKNNGYKYATN